MKFENFLNSLKESNETLDFFVDFEKVKRNVSKIEIKLHQLNYLIGKKDLEKAVEELWKENSSAFSILNILIAVRDNRKVLLENGEVGELENFFSSSIGVLKFLGETELSLIFQEVTNLVDFVFGVEVGLDTNARKNRTGKNMHSKIANIFRKENLPFQEEVQISELPNISLGLDENKFDFVIEAKRTYLIEVNFYNSGGSKLNEVARSYTEIAKKLNSENIQFVWITDGQGWKKAKNKLEEAYKNIPHLYNLHSLETFLQKVKSEI